MEKSSNLLIIFARNPRSEKVKTRLAKRIGKTKARELYERLLRRIIESLSESFTGKERSYDVKLYVLGNESYFHEFTSEENVIQQKGEDLGERMFNAFTSELRNYNNVILIGSDTPDINADFIEGAFRELKSNTRVDGVIGPAKDGGYYLVGLKRELDIFKGIEWGQPTVFGSTLALARKMDVTLSILDEKRDVDDVEDLLQLQHLI